MTDIDIVTRLTVLAALSRGTAFAHTALVCNASIDQVQEVAVEAGWPDIDAVRSQYNALRHGKPLPPAADIPTEPAPDLEREPVAPTRVAPNHPQETA